MGTPSQYPGIFVGLAAPFEEWQVYGRPGGGGKTLSYITARTAMNRFDEVVGPENWSDSYAETHSGLTCTITLTLPDGRTVSKSDGGGKADMPEGDNAEKSAYSDAFKRAAAKWGVGRYLYNDGVPKWIREIVKGTSDPDAPTQAPAKTSPRGEPAPRPALAKTDDRPCDRFMADASAKLLCHALDVYKHVLAVAVDQGHVKDGLRDDEQVIDDVTHLYRTQKAWVQQVVKGHVNTIAKAGQTAA